VTRKVRRKLNSTGKECCEICKEQNFLVQHHILGRKIKQANKHNNLANICSNCHIKIHKGDIIIEKRIMTTVGYVLIWHNKNESSITGDDSQVHMF
jgi:hypothetical protein